MPLDLAQQFIRKIGESFGPAYEPAPEVKPTRPVRYATFARFLEEAPVEVLQQTRDAMLKAWEAVREAMPVMIAADWHVADAYRSGNASAFMRIEQIDRAIARRSPPNVRPLTAEEEAELVARCDPSTWGRFPGQNGAE